jgi:formate-dependent phosphoribosylglycinamide formyltransferase (GAR transformylase)
VRTPHFNFVSGNDIILSELSKNPDDEAADTLIEQYGEHDNG